MKKGDVMLIMLENKENGSEEKPTYKEFQSWPCLNFHVAWQDLLIGLVILAAINGALFFLGRACLRYFLR